MAEDTKETSRRDFLKLGAVAAPAVALSATGAQADTPVQEDTGTGLRKTAHVDAYLKSARF